MFWEKEIFHSCKLIVFEKHLIYDQDFFAVIDQSFSLSLFGSCTGSWATSFLFVVVYDGSNIIYTTQNDNHYTNYKSKCSESVRFAAKEKYPNKVMAWIAISNLGISKTLFRPSNSETVDLGIYINECLEKRLQPFVLEHHLDSNYIFWPLFK